MLDFFVVQRLCFKNSISNSRGKNEGNQYQDGDFTPDKTYWILMNIPEAFIRETMQIKIQAEKLRKAFSFLIKCFIGTLCILMDY